MRREHSIIHLGHNLIADLIEWHTTMAEGRSKGHFPPTQTWSAPHLPWTTTMVNLSCPKTKVALIPIEEIEHKQTNNKMMETGSLANLIVFTPMLHIYSTMGDATSYRDLL
jgi:hypothetical protein